MKNHIFVRILKKKPMTKIKVEENNALNNIILGLDITVLSLNIVKFYGKENDLEDIIQMTNETISELKILEDKLDSIPLVQSIMDKYSENLTKLIPKTKD